PVSSYFFFFNVTTPTDISTLSLHDALPILNGHGGNLSAIGTAMQELHQETGAKIAVVNWWELGGDLIKEDFGFIFHACETETSVDRKSTRLNSSHDQISYAVFCLKKKKNQP